MFAVVYKFKVKPGSEAEFEAAWADRTCEIKQQYQSLGSRLHRQDDGSYLAYAQWPNRQLWEELGAEASPPSQAQLTMRESCESVETLFKLDLVKDLLEPLQ